MNFDYSSAAKLQESWLPKNRKTIQAVICSDFRIYTKAIFKIIELLGIIIAINLCMTCIEASAGEKISKYKYSSLFRQMFEKAFFLKKTGFAFYFPFQTPECRNLSDNHKGVQVNEREDIKNFMDYLSHLNTSIKNKDNYIAQFAKFIIATGCDPFYIDLTEKGLDNERKILQYSISYYREVGDEMVRTALSYLQKPILQISQFTVDNALMEILQKNRIFEKRDVPLDVMLWSSLHVKNIWIEKEQCNNLFNECTIVVNVKMEKSIEDFSD